MSQNGANQIEAMLAKLRQEFLVELPSRILELENLILESRDDEHYQEVYRQIHSMKGSGGTHGLDILSPAINWKKSWKTYRATTNLQRRQARNES